MESFTVHRVGQPDVQHTEAELRELVHGGALLFEIMDHTGDTKRIWDPTKPVEVEDARASFDRLKKEGYVAFRVDERGEAGEIMREFDPQAGRVIMRPPMAGG